MCAPSHGLRIIGGSSMRILIIGKKQIMHWPENVQKFLPNHETEIFFYNTHTPVTLFYKMISQRRRFTYVAQKLKRKIETFKPDLLLYISSFFIPQECYDILKDFPDIPRVGWVSDAFSSEQKPKADFLDVLFCSDTGYLKATKNFKSRNLFLPLCADETVFKNSHLPRTGAPFFAGVGNDKRNAYLAAIQDRCVIYGRRWPKEILSQHEVHNYKLQHDKLQDVINRTIAPINMTFSPNIIDGLNFRIFEIAACGGLIIVNESKDLKTCYTIGKEAVTYRTPQDLNKLIHDIVTHPDKYQKIAEAGFQRTMREHTYQKRIEQMFDILKTLGIIKKLD